MTTATLRKRPFEEHAIELSKYGPVFPVAPRGKVPLAGSHAGYDGTTDLDVIESWQAFQPEANIAWSTGNGLVCLDIDPRNGGDVAFKQMVNDVGPLPKAREVSTPGDGRIRGFHLWFEGPDETLHLAEGIDLLGKPGNYALAPYSITDNGEYEFSRELRRNPAFPDDHLAWLREHAAQRQPVRELSELVKVPGRWERLPERTWDLIRNGWPSNDPRDRDALLGSVMLTMARRKWSLAQAERVVLNPRFAVSQKLLEKSATWAARELERTWQRSVDLALDTEATKRVAIDAIPTLVTPGRTAPTDTAVLTWMIDKAARNPPKTEMRIDGGVFTARILGSIRVIAKDAGFTEKPVHSSINRLSEADLIDRHFSGIFVSGRKGIPSVFRLSLPVTCDFSHD